MVENRPDFERFVKSIVNRQYEDMVCLAEEEILATERLCYRLPEDDPSIRRVNRQYAGQLKAFLQFMRSDAARTFAGGNPAGIMGLVRNRKGEESLVVIK